MEDILLILQNSKTLKLPVAKANKRSHKEVIGKCFREDSVRLRYGMEGGGGDDAITVRNVMGRRDRAITMRNGGLAGYSCVARNKRITRGWLKIRGLLEGG